MTEGLEKSLEKALSLRRPSTLADEGTLRAASAAASLPRASAGF